MVDRQAVAQEQTARVKYTYSFGLISILILLQTLLLEPEGGPRRVAISLMCASVVVHLLFIFPALTWCALLMRWLPTDRMDFATGLT